MEFTQRMKSLVWQNNSGQSVVEYILLLFVVMTLVFTLVNSQAFQGIMGEDSEFFERLAKQQEYAFRHTHLIEINDDSSYTGPHHSYLNPNSNKSRFFSGVTPYPAE